MENFHPSNIGRESNCIVILSPVSQLSSTYKENENIIAL